MKFWKQILTCLVVLCLLSSSLFVFASCNDHEKAPEDTGDSSVVTTEQNPTTTAGDAGTTAPADTGEQKPPVDPGKDYSYSDGITDDIGNDKF